MLWALNNHFSEFANHLLHLMSVPIDGNVTTEKHRNEGKISFIYPLTSHASFAWENGAFVISCTETFFHQKNRHNWTLAVPGKKMSTLWQYLFSNLNKPYLTKTYLTNLASPSLTLPGALLLYPYQGTPAPNPDTF